MSPRQASPEPEHPSSPAHSTNSWEFLREDDFQEGEAARELPLSTSVVLAGSVDGEGSDTVVPVSPEDHASTPSTDSLIAAEPEDGESGRSTVEVSPCISSLATVGQCGNHTAVRCCTFSRAAVGGLCRPCC